MYFDGSSTIDTDTNVVIPAIGTVSLWFKPTLFDGGTHRVFGSRDQFEFRIVGTTLYEDLCINGGISLGTISVNNLYHALVRYNRNTGLADAWLNGSLINSATNHTTTPANAVLTIGNRTGSANGDRYYGYIDDFRIYNRWIANNEIEEIYSSMGSDFNVFGLLNRWLLLERDPNTVVSGVGSVKDFMGNLNHSLAAGTPLYSESMIKVRTKRSLNINYIN